MISKNSDREELEVVIKSNGYIVDEDLLTPEEDIKMIKQIPKQFADEGTKKVLE